MAAMGGWGMGGVGSEDVGVLLNLITMSIMIRLHRSYQTITATNIESLRRTPRQQEVLPRAAAEYEPRSIHKTKTVRVDPSSEFPSRSLVSSKVGVAENSVHD